MDSIQSAWSAVYGLISHAVTAAFPWINVILMIIAGCLGSMLFGKIKDPLREILLRSLGILVILMGFVELWDGFFVLQTGQFETVGTLLIVFVLPLGYAFGHGWSLDRALGKLGLILHRFFFKEKPQRPVPADGDPSIQPARRENTPSAEGFMLATVICAFSSTTIFSAWESQTAEDALPLLVRLGFHVLIFFMLSALFGSNCTLAAIPALAVELILLLASLLVGNLMTDTLMNQIRLVGAVILIATGLSLGFNKRVRSAKLIPAYALVIFFGLIMLMIDKLIVEKLLGMA